MPNKKIHIINGPNLNLLGVREPDIYGKQTFEEYLLALQAKFPCLEITYYQSNIEGEIINELQKMSQTADGILLNAGAYTHTSIAIADCIKAMQIPVVEIHISNVYAREEYRKTSYLAPVCKGSICGFGLQSYALGVAYFL